MPKAGHTKRLAKALALHVQGVNNSDIAKAVELSPGRITQILQEFSPILESKGVKPYIDSRELILSASEAHMLKLALQAARGEDADLSSITKLFKVIFEARRLEAGLSTSNQAIQTNQFLRVPLSDADKD